LVVVIHTSRRDYTSSTFGVALAIAMIGLLVCKNLRRLNSKPFTLQIFMTNQFADTFHTQKYILNSLLINEVGAL
jgi:hypothetical protein